MKSLSHYAGVLTIGFIFGCTPTPIDRTPVDPGPSPGPDWEHCPTTAEESNPNDWAGLLEITNGALYCQRPEQHDDMTRALSLRKQMRLVAGRYPLPTRGEDHPIDLPFCFRDETGPIDALSAGTANAGNDDFFMEGPSWWVRGSQAHGDSGAHLQWMTLGPADDPYVLVDGTEAFSQDLILTYCDTATCSWEERSLFTSCDAQPNTCDRFEMEGGDSLSLDQYHWVGPVGGGFANITEARGVLYGQAFTISSPSQLFMTYGHHAFTRSGTIFFDEPIEGACGLFIDTVTERSNIYTVDCDGTPIDPLVLTGETHEYLQGPCP